MGLSVKSINREARIFLYLEFILACGLGQLSIFQDLILGESYTDQHNSYVQIVGSVLFYLPDVDQILHSVDMLVKQQIFLQLFEVIKVSIFSWLIRLLFRIVIVNPIVESRLILIINQVLVSLCRIYHLYFTFLDRNRIYWYVRSFKQYYVASATVNRTRICTNIPNCMLIHK